ncbi:AUX/IAA family [Musa troglodytarum]|uniref:Fucosyltransferase n=1 Tax=Musa troglodytarum TaxID=320322 RepID=A0A9E7GP38_9LILI|nr:AUX/IAA family [Musa troglodytarum]
MGSMKRSTSCRILAAVGGLEAKLERNSTTTFVMSLVIPVLCLLCVPFLVYRRPTLEWLQTIRVTAGIAHHLNCKLRLHEVIHERNTVNPCFNSPKQTTVAELNPPVHLLTTVGSVESPEDKSLGGLLPPGFDESSCLSRYQAALYRKASPHKPSPFLVEKLRRYEALHRKCGPNTELYNRSIQQLESDHSTGPMECNYVVWIPHYGLGNRVMSIVSGFLYALLNDKVLLIHVDQDMEDLFCEPFPDTSWVLPKDFPIENLGEFEGDATLSYGKLIRDKIINNDMRFATKVTLPAYVYLHLPWYSKEWDRLFYCEDAQQMLRKIPWLLLRTDEYFVPSLFLVDEYAEDLQQLFPERTTVFHHLVRYLFHPTNTVWGYVMRYYQGYLAKADERIGIQIRIFPLVPIPFETMLNQIINCTLSQHILPAIDPQEPAAAPSNAAKVKAVLVTNLNSGYHDRLRDMYYEHSTTTGEVITVHQPSHEKQQYTDQRSHNVKAWSEITLLSFSDVLVTTAWSTFGYVAQGLGGLKPWILPRHPRPGVACVQAVSTEACFHAPPDYDCKARKGGADLSAVAPFVRHCEDVEVGLKLFD